MAYRDAVDYIANMRPDVVGAAGDGLRRAHGGISAAMPALSGLPGTVEWNSGAATAYDQRLRETVGLVEGLHDGFDRAGGAVADYAAAQTRAQALVADGRAAEDELRSLMLSVPGNQGLTLPTADVLRGWEDLRASDGLLDGLDEGLVREQIEAVRPRADALWARATAAYDDAIRVETDARTDTVDRLASARRLVPDFKANSPLSEQIAAQATAGPLGADGFHIGPPTRPELVADDDFPFDPAATPTPGDYVSWNKWGATLDGGRALRSDLDDATALYAHYRDGTGTDATVDYEEAYAEDPAIRAAVDAQIRTAQQEAERLHRETGRDEFSMTGGPRSVSDLGGYPDTENWQKSLGDHQIYGTSDVVVHGDQATMKITVKAEDVYNFNRGDADIASGAPDSENGRFAELGWAKPFHSHGELERTVTWTIGADGAPDVGGGDGPERAVAGHEDRADSGLPGPDRTVLPTNGDEGRADG